MHLVIERERGAHLDQHAVGAPPRQRSRRQTASGDAESSGDSRQSVASRRRPARHHAGRQGERRGRSPPGSRWRTGRPTPRGPRLRGPRRRRGAPSPARTTLTTFATALRGSGPANLNSTGLERGSSSISGYGPTDAGGRVSPRPALRRAGAAAALRCDAARRERARAPDAAGRTIVTVVPTPRRLSISIVPSSRRTSRIDDGETEAPARGVRLPRGRTGRGHARAGPRPSPVRSRVTRMPHLGPAAASRRAHVALLGELGSVRRVGSTAPARADRGRSRRRVGGDVGLEADRPRVEQRAHHVVELGHEVGDGHGAALVGDSSLLDPRQVEEVVDERQLHRRRAEDARERVGLVARERPKVSSARSCT